MPAVVPTILLLALGCTDPKYWTDTASSLADDGGGGAEGADSGGGDDGGADGGGAGGEIAGPAIAGVVRVELYHEDSAGNRTEVAWEDSGFGTEFPFGSIFVAATTTGEDGELIYWGTDTIASPTIDGDPYVVELDEIPTAGMQVYAALDLGDDGVLSIDEPMGVCADEVLLASTTVARDKDIVILVPR